MKQFLNYLLTRFGGAILLSLLPIGYIFDAILQMCSVIHERLLAPEQHDRRLAEIQQQVRRWYTQPAGTRQPLCTDGHTWQLKVDVFAMLPCEAAEPD